MRVYIAIGGIGCRILYNFQRENDVDKYCCFYLDTDVNSIRGLVNNYCFGYTENGAGSIRSIGKNAIRYDIYSNNLSGFFEPIKKYDKVKLVFITSSFGGTGSGAVFELADYLQALLWEKGHSRCVECKIIAFTNKSINYMKDFPKVELHQYEMNTINTVIEALAKDATKAETELYY